MERITMTAEAEVHVALDDVNDMRRKIVSCFDIARRCVRLRNLLYATSERMLGAARFDDEIAAYRGRLLRDLMAEGGTATCRAELAAKRLELGRQMAVLKADAEAKPEVYAWLKRNLQWSPFMLHLLQQIVEKGVTAEDLT